MTSPTKAAELADWHAQQAEQRRQALGWQGEDKVTGPALRKLHADIEFHAQACDSIRALIAPNGVIAWAHPDGRVVPASTMESAKRDGGAMESSLAGYTIPCVAALLRASEGRVPETDVRSILLDVVPGPDGMGVEVYAQNVGDVERKLSELCDKLESHEFGNQPAPLTVPIPDGYDSSTLTGKRVILLFESQDAAVTWLEGFYKAYDAAKGTKTMNIVLPLTAAPHPPAQQAAPTLWCIAIPGPDEHHAAPSEDAAKHMAQRHNAVMVEHFERHPDPEGVGPLRESCLAQVRRWPWSAEEHAKALEGFDAKAWGWSPPPHKAEGAEPQKGGV